MKKQTQEKKSSGLSHFCCVPRKSPPGDLKVTLSLSFSLLLLFPLRCSLLFAPSLFVFCSPCTAPSVAGNVKKKKKKKKCAPSAPCASTLFSRKAEAVWGSPTLSPLFLKKRAYRPNTKTSFVSFTFSFHTTVLKKQTQEKKIRPLTPTTMLLFFLHSLPPFPPPQSSAPAPP